jgi:sister-chromatid-cohesion protein PDS5
MEGMANKMKKLLFQDKIVSTATNPITTKELQTRLIVLQKELSSLEQNEVDLVSLEEVKDNLINKKLLKNPNKGIQINVACCLADILRLYAPNAPYSISNLSNIFKLFLQQFAHLDDQESTFYLNYVYLLDTVAQTKLITLMSDLENSDKFVIELFDCLYSLASNKNFDIDNLQNLLIDVLNEIISEVNQLDIKVLKLILNKFLANSKNLKNQSNIKVPGFEISLALCEVNSDKLSRLVTYFFSEMILEATKENETDFEFDSENDTDETRNVSSKGNSNIDLIQMKKIHNLAIELWRYVPEILTSVLGLLDNELEADDPVIRSIATGTVSKILAIQPSRINFPTTFIETYMNWLKKPLDVSVDIRLTWITGLYEILEVRNDICSDISNSLLKTLIDLNDKVRLATIVELSKLKPTTFLNKVLNNSLTDTLLKLLREKNNFIRNEIIQFLSTLYNHFANFETFETNDFIFKIPNHILNLIYINDLTINSEIDFAIFEKFCPINTESDKRVQRLLLMLYTTSEKSNSAFSAIVTRQTQLSQVILQLLDIIEDNNDYDKEDKINNAIKWISKSFPKSYNAEECLQCFVKSNNQRLYRLLKLCATETTDYDTIVNSMKEILNRVKEPKFINNVEIDISNITSLSIHSTMKLLLLRSSNIFYNISNISELIDVNTNSQHRLHFIANTVLNSISKVCPNVLSSSMSRLTEKILDLSKTINFEGSRLSNDCWKDLKVVYNCLNKDQTHIALSKDFYNALYDFTIKGTVLEAKFSVKIISNSSGDIKGLLFTKMVNEIWPLNFNSVYFNTHLSTLSALFLCDIVSVEHIKEDISKFLAGEILLKNHLKEEEDNEAAENLKEEFWITDDDLFHKPENSNCMSKILSMKLLTNWLVSIKDHPAEQIEPVCKPILSMLSSFINRGGEIVVTEDTPLRYCSRLRLHAGIQLLKLSRYSAYDAFIDQRRINRLILLIQDVQYEVRLKFLDKLKKSLAQNSISKRFLSLIFFVAFEPNQTLREKTSTWIRASFSRQNIKSASQNLLIYEKSYIRLLHMIFNHPEFKELYISYKSTPAEIANDHDVKDDSEQVKRFKELATFVLTYVVYALSLIITSENISLLYYLIQRIKQFKSVALIENSEENSDGLYLISELSQSAIKNLAKIRNWSILIWPGKLNLPHDLFTKLDNNDANEIVNSNYILDEYSSFVSEIIKGRWSFEHGVRNANKSKRKAKEISNSVLEEINANEIVAVGDSTIKNKLGSTKKAKKDTLSKENDSDYQIPKATKNKENIDITNVRRSGRSKRLNYLEEE